MNILIITSKLSEWLKNNMSIKHKYKYYFNYNIIIILFVFFLISFLFMIYKEELQLYFAQNDYTKKVDAGINLTTVKLPIVMYHHILNTSNMPSSLYITPVELECDFKYIQEHGYKAINMEDLIEYVYKNKALPPKPILLSFDDGYLNNYVYAFPLLKKYNLKIVLSLIGKSTDDFTNKSDINLDYSYATWGQINQMLQSGNVEIQNHSYNLHSLKNGRRGCSKNPGEEFADYATILNNDIGYFQNYLMEKIHIKPTTFCYPFGYISKESVIILKNMGFKGSLSSYGGINYINHDPNNLFSLKRNNRPHGISSADFFAKLSKYK